MMERKNLVPGDLYIFDATNNLGVIALDNFDTLVYVTHYGVDELCVVSDGCRSAGRIVYPNVATLYPFLHLMNKPKKKVEDE